MSAYSNWSRGLAKQIIRRELMDPTGKWWSDSFLNLQVDQWQNELQQDYELVWGSSTVITALNTIAISTISPPMSRLDAIYFIGTNSGDRGYRLAGRSLQDLEVSNHQWRDANSDTPREVIQYDSTQMIIWPPLAQTGTFVFEYPLQLSFSDDSSLISLPPWAQWSIKPYVCAKAYLMPGATNDLQKALKYRKIYEKEKANIKLLWDNWLPERYRRLKPAASYEWDILKPPPAWSAPFGGGGTTPDSYRSFIPTGATDGVNLIFTIPISPTVIKVFLNGLLMNDGGVDYTFGGSTVTFVSPLSPGSEVVIWTFTKGS